ncbi:unnamed protein product, partial [Ectocarpus sp. 8 AP-2014]
RYDARGVDTWCAGLCLFALVTGRLPFRAKGSEATLDIIQTMEPTYPEGLPPLLTDLLRGMLRKDPSKRLSVPAVMGHPWTSARLNTCVDLEEQTHLARMAVQEAKLAAPEAERKAAFALAATGDAPSAVEPPPAAAAAAQGKEDKHDGRGIPRSRSGSGNRSLGGQTGGPAVASKAPGGEEEAAAAARTSRSSSSANQGGGRNFARLLRRRASMEETGRGGGGGKPPALEKQAEPSSQRGRGGGTGGGGGGGGGGSAIQRPASVDYRRDDVTLGPRQDNEWMTPPRDSSHPAVRSSLGRPEPAGGESGVAAGGGAGDECGRGPVVAGSVFAGTAESAAAAAAAATGSGAVARRKMLRRSQSAVPSKGPVTNGTRGAAAEIAAAATVPEEAVGKGPSSSSPSSSTSAAASNLVKQGSRSGIGKRGGSIRSKIRRSLSSVFGPTSSTSSSPPPDPAPVPVPLPPPIEHSTSLDSMLAPGAAKTPRAGASGVSAVPPVIDRCVSFDLVVPAASMSTAAAAAASTSASFSSGAVFTPPPSQQPRADEKSLNAGAADGQAAAIPEAVAVAKKEEAALQQPSALSRFLASTQREKKKMARSVTPEPEPEPPAAAAATVAVATGDGGGGGSGGGSPDGLLPGERRQERPRSSSLTRAPPSDPTQGANHFS